MTTYEQVEAGQVARSRASRQVEWATQAIIALAAVLLLGLAVALLLRNKQIDLQTLNGRWLRPDGGYILEIRAVDSSGKIDAVYLNPKPINIAKADASRDGSTVKVFVVLRAPNYPGSTIRGSGKLYCYFEVCKLWLRHYGQKTTGTFRRGALPRHVSRQSGASDLQRRSRS